MNKKRIIRKILSITLAMVLVLSMAAVSFADTTTGTMTANVYVPKEFNPFYNLLMQLTGHDTAYLTSNALFPTSGSSNNADYTYDGSVYTITIPIENYRLSWTAIGDYSVSNVDALKAATISMVATDGTSTGTVKVTDTDDNGTYDGKTRISEITVTVNSLDTEYYIEDCDGSANHPIAGTGTVSDADFYVTFK